jgi:hypothetical protein
VDGFTRARRKLGGDPPDGRRLSHDRAPARPIGAVGEYDVDRQALHASASSIGRCTGDPEHVRQPVSGVTRLRVTDCTGGFRCWRRDALERLPLERIVSEGYAFQVEMLYEAQRAGCRIGEVPIIFIERREGQSKLSKGVIVESVLMPWRLLLRRPRPASASGLPCK